MKKIIWQHFLKVSAHLSARVVGGFWIATLSWAVSAQTVDPPNSNTGKNTVISVQKDTPAVNSAISNNGNNNNPINTLPAPKNIPPTALANPKPLGVGAPTTLEDMGDMSRSPTDNIVPLPATLVNEGDNLPTRVYHHPILNKISQQAVVNIQTTGGQSQEKQSVGSGFFISKDGYIVTNFHVISEHFFNPKDTKLLVRIGANDISPLEASLENVDLINDLALLKIKAPQTQEKNKEKITEPAASSAVYQFLEFSTQPLDAGQKVYSLGFPNNWNLTAIEGIANGNMSRKIIPRYLISHSLTGGMSGGPTVDENGVVVGINVAATAKLSVVIPSPEITRLFETRFKVALTPNIEEGQKIKYLRDKTYKDYDAFSEKLIHKIADTTLKMKLGNFNLDLDGDFMECWSAGIDKNNIWSGKVAAPESKYDNTVLSCATTDEVFLTEKQKLGGVRFYVSHYQAEQDLVFWKNLENVYNLTTLRNATLLEQSGLKTSFHCQHENIQVGAAQKMHTCVAQLKQNSNLYQALITIGAYKKVAAPTTHNQALVLTVIANGFSASQLKVLNKYLYQFSKDL